MDDPTISGKLNYMNNANENQRNNRMQYWGLKFVMAVMLIIVGYKAPTIWLSISATIWAVYAVSIITSPLLIAASQNPGFAKIANRTISILGNMATAALISAPIVMLHWWRVTYLSNR